MRKVCRGWVILVVFAVALAGCRREPAVRAPAAFDKAPGFWVWHRSSGLSDEEKKHLPEGGRIYRQIAEFGLKDGSWKVRPVARPEVLGETDIVVVRLDAGPAIMDRHDSAAMLARWLRHHFDGEVPGRVQLDYDCPVRLLPRYARFLSEVRTELPELGELSITALASWIDSPALVRVGDVVDELVPMFYDLAADESEAVAAGRVRPIGGEESRAWISRWKSWPRPWRAGLPNLERLTLYRADGSLVGHLRNWSPEIFDRPEVMKSAPGNSGAAHFRISRDAVLQGTAVKENDHLIWRAPAEADIRNLPELAERCGARGVVWFALPGPGLRAARSASHVATARAGTPSAGIRIGADKDGRLTVRNEGPGDIFLAPGEAMHRLVLQADVAGTFGRADAGDFAMVPGSVPAEFSREIVLTFPRLLVGEEIASGIGWMSTEDDRGCRWSLDDSPFAPLP